MDSISKKITSRPGFSKAILVIREKIVSRSVRSCLVIIISLVLDMSEVIAMGRACSCHVMVTNLVKCMVMFY